MSGWHKAGWQAAPLLLLVCMPALADQGDYLLAGGLESDTDGTLAVSATAERALTDATWGSLTAAHTNVDIERRPSLDTWYAEAGLDHHFDPLGVRLAAVYWGDDAVLDSVDGRFRVYWREPRFTLAGDFEYRDFEFDLPGGTQLPGRTVSFDARGVGAMARLDLGESVDVSVSGMSYDYSVNLRLDQNRGIARLLNVSRLSLINSLVDERVSFSVGFEQALRRYELSLSSWEGAVDGSRTRSATLRFLTPLSDRSDIELGLGYDDSDLYGDVTFFSVFLYFYGGGA
ncbi:MAG: hypothetical protein AAGE85_09435 [Pseudomonadota bacterium]